MKLVSISLNFKLLCEKTWLFLVDLGFELPTENLKFI